MSQAGANNGAAPQGGEPAHPHGQIPAPPAVVENPVQNPPLAPIAAEIQAGVADGHGVPPPPAMVPVPAGNDVPVAAIGGNRNQDGNGLVPQAPALGIGPQGAAGLPPAAAVAAPQDADAGRLFSALEALITSKVQSSAPAANQSGRLPGGALSGRIPAQLMPSQIQLFDPLSMDPEDFFRDLDTLLVAFGCSDQLVVSFPVFLSPLPRVLWNNMINDPLSKPLDYPTDGAYPPKSKQDVLVWLRHHFEPKNAASHYEMHYRSIMMQPLETLDQFVARATMAESRFVSHAADPSMTRNSRDLNFGRILLNGLRQEFRADVIKMLDRDPSTRENVLRIISKLKESMQPSPNSQRRDVMFLGQNSVMEVPNLITPKPVHTGESGKTADAILALAQAMLKNSADRERDSKGDTEKKRPRGADSDPKPSSPNVPDLSLIQKTLEQGFAELKQHRAPIFNLTAAPTEDIKRPIDAPVEYPNKRPNGGYPPYPPRNGRDHNDDRRPFSSYRNEKRGGVQKCFLCGQMGHIQERCWELEANKNHRPSGWNSRLSRPKN